MQKYFWSPVLGLTVMSAGEIAEPIFDKQNLIYNQFIKKQIIAEKGSAY